MTVKELIEYLQECQENADVVFINYLGEKEQIKKVTNDGDVVYLEEY